jgi:hypothetical protein
MMNGWMLLQRRQASLSSGNEARARCASPSEARKASAASSRGRVDTPVASRAKRPSSTRPSAVTPRNGSAISASPVSAYRWRFGDSGSGRLRADMVGRCLNRSP